MKPNLLGHGDNLRALDRLMPVLEGRVQCVYIDPPFNTGSLRKGTPGGAGYPDRLPAEAWLDALERRLELLWMTLRPEGSILVHLDDNGVDYVKVAMDRMFGRRSFVNRIVVTARAPSSFSTVNAGLFKAAEYLLWYARDRRRMTCHPPRVPREPDPAYRLYLENPTDPPESWRLVPLRKACPPGTDPRAWQVERADRACRLAPIHPTKAGRAFAEAVQRSLRQPGRVFPVERPGRPTEYVIRGQQVLFYERQVAVVDGRRVPSRPLTSVWTDLAWEGIAREGGVRFKHGKKPEALLRRCLLTCTEPGDLVLDAYAGAGTTAAVAHKMRRRWVAIERGPAVELARERLERVVAGADRGGVTKVEGWEGGGGFSFLPMDPG